MPLADGAAHGNLIKSLLQCSHLGKLEVLREAPVSEKKRYQIYLGFLLYLFIVIHKKKDEKAGSLLSQNLPYFFMLLPHITVCLPNDEKQEKKSNRLQYPDAKSYHMRLTFSNQMTGLFYGADR